MKPWVYHVGNVILFVAIIAMIVTQLAMALTPSQELCAALQAQGASQCIVQDAQLVQSDVGVYLISGGETYRLQ